jgi:hypothetical protein
MFLACHIYPQLAQWVAFWSQLQFMVPHMVRIFLSLALVCVGITPVFAADLCQETACINVYTDENQIIIEARKGKSTVKKRITQAPKRGTVTATPKATAVPLFFPSTATSKPVVKKPTVKRTYKPRIRKAVTKVNLSDRLTKLVPTAGVAYQPEFEPLVNVPVFFWCDLPTLFHSRVDIIGEVVDVALRPSFVWSFGDGSVYATTENGAPYPDGTILHTYKQPGTYQVSLLTTWNGTYTHNAASRAVTGSVKKVSIALITIVKASTTFKG